MAGNDWEIINLLSYIFAMDKVKINEQNKSLVTEPLHKYCIWTLLKEVRSVLYPPGVSDVVTSPRNGLKIQNFIFPHGIGVVWYDGNRMLTAVSICKVQLVI